MLHWGTNLTSTIFGYGYSKKRCESITTWFINKYLPRHKLTIDIVHRSLFKDDCYGYLDASNYSRPRSFTISLHSKMKEIDLCQNSFT